MTEKAKKQEMHRLARERVTEISREFSEGFKFLENHPRSVTFFGGNQVAEDSQYYEDARRLSQKIVRELGYAVLSGGGPGIMEAANRGAYEAGGDSLGLLIDLPEGQPTNRFINKSLLFYYFFVRKVCLAFSAEAFIFYPGGIGTLDEFFEILTLVQTKKVDGVPIICVGSDYWGKIKGLLEEEVLKRGLIKDGETSLFTITDDHDKILQIIKETPVVESAPFNGAKH